MMNRRANHSSGSGTWNHEFGRTTVVRPKGRHLATIVWLHGLGHNGSSSSQLLQSLPIQNVKWICPTAPTRPVQPLGGLPWTSWFDVAEEISEDTPADTQGLDASAAHIANLLSAEPSDIKLGIGGFDMGATTALYSATCYALGRYGNRNTYPINLKAVVGLSGWLPGASSLKSKVEMSHDALRRATYLPMLMCHGKCDQEVACKYGEKSAQALWSAGFHNLVFKTYDGLGHYTTPMEMEEVSSWLTSRLALDGYD